MQLDPLDQGRPRRDAAASRGRERSWARIEIIEASGLGDRSDLATDGE
jgi:hypothetical protein